MTVLLLLTRMLLWWFYYYDGPHCRDCFATVVLWMTMRMRATRTMLTIKGCIFMEQEEEEEEKEEIKEKEKEVSVGNHTKRSRSLECNVQKGSVSMTGLMRVCYESSEDRIIRILKGKLVTKTVPSMLIGSLSEEEEEK